MITDYLAKYIAPDLTRRRSSDSTERMAVAGAQVDMNPHQVDAALFAVASPLSKGALLADEVGLEKTAEAGFLSAETRASAVDGLLCQEHSIQENTCRSGRSAISKKFR